MSDIEETVDTKMAHKNDFEVKKLKGSENYHTWQFAMINYLELRDLEYCIVAKDDSPNVPVETKADRLKKAKSILVLGIKESLFVHIRSATTALEIWTKLKKMFEDNGLLRKIGLLRALISVRLESMPSMQGYVDEIVNTASKLSGIGFNIGDEWIGAILLAGLTDEYKPLIMSIEGSALNVTADVIKQKLLDMQLGNNASGEVFFTKRKGHFKSRNNHFTCHNGGKNHKSIHYTQSKAHSDDSDSSIVSTKSKKPIAAAKSVMVETKGWTNVSNNRSSNGTRKNAFSAKGMSTDVNQHNEWYIDSGASNHMTPYVELFDNKISIEEDGIFTADNSKMSVNCAGKTILRISKNEIEVNNVLHVPDVSANLLSVAKIVNQGNTVVFDKNGCTIYNVDSEIISHCKQRDGVYKIRSDQGKCMLARANGVKINRSNTHRSSKVWTKGERPNETLKKAESKILENIKRIKNEVKFVSVRAIEGKKQSDSQMGQSTIGESIVKNVFINEASNKDDIYKVLDAY